ncbi:WxL domain-containing protein [Enterococcus plantarum]|uniref:WxL domain-containing protein n=1 Tax=Enterococcus plantarum TaxID=1077675 RepID=UPI001A906036|nr:WxL domain-containing protein [Enterococcus plantarum]MBO0468688.1 WxL domain-containing protein [Enterococcus plantarum]
MKKFINYASITLLTLTTATALSSVAHAEKTAEYQTNGLIEFVPNDSITNPVDPKDPDPTKPVTPTDPTKPGGPDPGTPGPLSIDYASSLDFGQNKITANNEVYYANAQGFSGGEISGEYRGNYVQVSDNRGTFAGWTLTLKQDGQFKNDNAKKAKSLTGAQISLTNAAARSNSTEDEKPVVKDIQLNPTGDSVAVMSAKDGVGAGLWVNEFGQAEEVTVDGKSVQKNKAVTLSIPGSTAKEAVNYSTKLVWTLSDVPSE